LQADGYQTAIIGKWHLGSTPTGFNYYSIHEGQGTYYSPTFIEPNGKITYEGTYATDITLENSIKWLEKIDKSKPFCLMMHFKAPHRNWMPAPNKMDMYENTIFPVPSNFFDDYEGRLAAKEQKMSIEKDMTLSWDLKMLGIDNTKGQRLESELNRMTSDQRNVFDEVYLPLKEDFLKQNLHGRDLAIWKYQRYMRDYLKCISSIDDNVGKMLEYLEKNDLLDNTIIVYTSDQGFYLGEHGWFDKRFMYEESFHTPLIISFPSMIKPGRESNALIQNIDFAPTFLDLAGIKIPTDIQGESMVSILNGSKDKIRDNLYYHYYEFLLPHGVKRHYGIRTERYKLIHFYYDIDTWELYDLKNDPHEMKNLITDKNIKV
jgi:arylsulfatase A-like enzyme